MKVNWYEARRWFVYGGDSVITIEKKNKATAMIHFPTYQEIANHYCVHLQTIAKRANKEKWIDLRRFAQDEISKEIEKRLKEMQIKSLSEVNAEHFKIGSAVLAKFLDQLNANKTTVYAGDALAWGKLRQEISEKASGIDDDENVDAYKEFMKKVIKGD